MIECSSFHILGHQRLGDSHRLWRLSDRWPDLLIVERVDRRTAHQLMIKKNVSMLDFTTNLLRKY
jgi:hypothetical protein